MSEKDIEKERQEFYGELSGSRAGLYAGTMISEQVKKEAELFQRQSKEKFQDTYEALQALCDQAYSDLMAQINRELEAVRFEMEKNRKDWGQRADRLEEIDEVFEAVKDGKQLDKVRAQHIIQSAGNSLPENADNADYYTLLVAIKADDLKHIEVLDTNFQSLEKQEQHYKTVKQKAQHIANDDSLDGNQRLAAYENLNNEMSKADLIIASRNAENLEQQLDAETVAKNDYDQQIETSTYSLSKLNF